MSNIVKWAAVSDEETFAKVRVEFSFGDGSAVQKTVTMADFIRAMSTIEAEQERCLEIGQIPNGFYDGVLIQNKEQSFDVIITVSAHLGVIYLFGVPKQVVFPDLAFLFKVREGMVSASFCFALKRDESGMIGPASRLCYYPFGNVYDNGKICWGNTVFPKMTSIKDAEKLAAQQAEAKKAEPRKEVGFIAVSIGEGMNEIFRELGADYIIEGGQTMNPSTEDMLNAIDQVNAEHIFILPNNKNIILAANQAQTLTEDKDIIVVPSKTVPQGITAIINYMPDADAQTNLEAMIEGIGNVKTGQVTYAVRDTHIDDKEIHEGDIMGIGDSGILAVGQSVEETTKEMLAQLVDEDTELISLYYGQDVQEESAENFAQEIEDLYPDVDVDVHSGGQPIYYYVISVE